MVDPLRLRTLLERLDEEIAGRGEPDLMVKANRGFVQGAGGLTAKPVIVEARDRDRPPS